MDTRFFVSREEFHNVQMDVRQLQAVQSTQIERIQRLEKRHQDDAAMRSAWSNSPFPSALVGTPQHGTSFYMLIIFISISELLTNNLPF